MRPAIASLLLLLACTSAVLVAVTASEDDAKVRELPTPRHCRDWLAGGPQGRPGIGLTPHLYAGHALLQLKKLQALQRKGGGMIELDSKTAQALLVGKSRPYSVFIVAGALRRRWRWIDDVGARGRRRRLAAAPMPARSTPSPSPNTLLPLPPPADAKDLRSQSKLKLGQLVSDFQLVGKTFAATHAGKPSAGSALFARMEFSKTKELFGRLGVQALPYLVRIPPSLPISEAGAVTVDKEDQLSASGYPWSPEAIADFVAQRSGVAVGDVKRPPLIGPRCGWGRQARGVESAVAVVGRARAAGARVPGAPSPACPLTGTVLCCSSLPQIDPSAG